MRWKLKPIGEETVRLKKVESFYLRWKLKLIGEEIVRLKKVESFKSWESWGVVSERLRVRDREN